MCGIVGIVSRKGAVVPKDHGKIFSQLLWADMFRGKDSTGFYAIESTGEILSHKRALRVDDFMRTWAYEDLLRDIHRYPVVIGHNRASTVGATTDMNAHPHEDGDIILVHNGTLYDYYNMRPPKRGGTTDSARIAAMLNDLSSNAATRGLAELQGSYAVVWYDSRDESVNIARNSQRPLFWTLSANRDHMYLASELQMLQWILGRNDVSIWDEKQPWRFPKPHMHYKIFCQDGPDSIQTFEYTPIERRVYSYHSQRGYYSGKGQTLPALTGGRDTTPASGTQTSTKDTNSPKEQPLTQRKWGKTERKRAARLGRVGLEPLEPLYVKELEDFIPHRNNESMGSVTGKVSVKNMQLTVHVRDVSRAEYLACREFERMFAKVIDARSPHGAETPVLIAVLHKEWHHDFILSELQPEKNENETKVLECSWCNNPLSLEKKKIWVNDSPICEKCYVDEQFLSAIGGR